MHRAEAKTERVVARRERSPIWWQVYSNIVGQVAARAFEVGGNNRAASMLDDDALREAVKIADRAVEIGQRP